MTQFHNPLNTTAEAFDLEKFNELVNTLKRTHKTVVSMDSTFEETQEKLRVAKDNLQEAMDNFQLDEMQKFTAECKRLKSRLGEDPAVKVAEFDDAVKAIVAFFQPVEAAKTAPDLTVVDNEQLAA